MKKQPLHPQQPGKTLPAIILLLLILISSASHAQLAAGKSKFLGNVTGSSVPANFSTYWNQITPENASKWGSVEPNRDQMNWGQMQTAYNYAKSRGYKFKHHTLVWGSQFPGWLTSLSQADQRAEIIEWYQASAQTFPNLDFIDVVNEPIKTACPFKNALGGDGTTGWDWVIEAFRLARQYFPNAKLLINEYGTENDPSARNTYIQIINLLKNRGYIDGIGLQAHYFNVDNMTGSQMTATLNQYANTGIDIYISELDITGGGTETGQRNKYADLFPAMWNHPSVKGITLWGYIWGQTWRPNTGLVNTNGTERQAMTWLKSFMAGGGGNRTITVRARGTNGSERLELRVNNTVISTWTLTTSMQNYTATAGTGTIRVQFINDATSPSRDVQVDYISTGSTTFQSENQSVNTGAYINGSCGGGGNSEWLHCNGYIEYAGSSSSGKGIVEELITSEEEPGKAGSVYPNPVPSGSFDISLAGLNGMTDIQITDMNGKLVKRMQINAQPKLSIYLDVRPGTYIVTGRNGSFVFKKKLIVL